MDNTAGPAVRKLTNHELLRQAHGALSRVIALPPGSAVRALQWAVFDQAMDELAVRYSAAGFFGEDMRRRALELRGGEAAGGGARHEP